MSNELVYVKFKLQAAGGKRVSGTLEYDAREWNAWTEQDKEQGNVQGVLLDMKRLAQRHYPDVDWTGAHAEITDVGSYVDDPNEVPDIDPVIDPALVRWETDGGAVDHGIPGEECEAGTCDCGTEVPVPSGVITVPWHMTDEEAEALRARWLEIYAGRPTVSPQGPFFTNELALRVAKFWADRAEDSDEDETQVMDVRVPPIGAMHPGGFSSAKHATNRA